MAQIVWQKELEIGNEMIDTQHRMLVLLLRKLEIAFDQQLPHTIIVGICLEIKKFTDFHFLSEENLMRELCYPGLRHHAEAHSHLLMELELLIHKVNHGTETTDNLLKIMYAWVADHVLNEDKKIADFVSNSASHPIGEAEYGLYLK